MSEPNDPYARAVDWSNWAGDERCRPAAVEIPGSIEELSGAIVRAGAHDRRVRVAGSGHSFSDIALTDGVQLRLDRLRRVLDIDRSSGLVRVQAGITIRELNARLAEHGLAMENLGDVDSQTLAGAISTATHGTGARLRNISAQVAELTLVLADGSILRCAEELDAGVFRAVRVGLGALGVVAEVTLRCVPAFTLRGVDAPAPLAETLARFEELSLGNDHFELYEHPYTRLERATAELEAPFALLELVNGGGTGSLESTAAEAAVTEVTAGSGLYGPTLFDAYRAFAPRPAALFALPVVRRPGPGVVTALGGGYLASGPADRARLPQSHLPPGLRLDRQEGAGEVQTPLLGAAADGLSVGDRVYMRHAKAGELCERFASLYLLEGERIVEEVPTYRGEGQCFL